jgi:SAM-dependent methyltransferase
MEDLTTDIFFEVHSGLPRQGPGDAESTARALSFMSGRSMHPHILDIGCGTGAQTLDLAALVDGQIIAVDNHQPFLDTLQLEAVDRRINHKISVVNADMKDLKYADHSFDIIWSEGAIYIIGFENGLRDWQRLLKPHGYVAVTELSWLASSSPAEIREFWNREYPNMNPVHQNLKLITDTGYRVVGHFTLPTSSWWNDYYQPLESRLSALRVKHSGDQQALAVIESSQLEINLYRKYSDYYGYVFYIMRLG